MLRWVAAESDQYIDTAKQLLCSTNKPWVKRGVAVKQLSWYAASLTVWSPYSGCVVSQCMNASTVNILCDSIIYVNVFILHNLLHTKSLVLPLPHLTDSPFHPLWKSSTSSM